MFNNDEDQSYDDEKNQITLDNKKQIPLDWNGKPIALWIYKLHGLHKSYNCEICGNYNYKGHNNFIAHFKESRHSYGLKCLGIENTRHFYGITTFNDAIDLHQKLMKKNDTTTIVNDDNEEVEDSNGNVMSKKVYNLMKKQGLIT